jgi:TolA-binding protein
MSVPARDPEFVASALGELARRGAESRPVVDEQVARSRLLLRAAAKPARQRWQDWRVALPALAVAAALLVWWAVPSALRYEVVGAEKDGAYVSAPSDHAVSVHFSDETLVEVAQGSQLRVEDTSRRGARVLLERGLANVHVVHRDRAHWTFAAGPFEVLVTGTRFDLKWDPAAEVLELRLREGSVEIQTPFGSAPVALRAGQTFRADLHQRAMTTTDASTKVGQPEAAALPSSSATPASETASSASPASSGPPASPPSAVVSSSAAARPWPKLVAAGQFTAVLAQAEERGVGNCLHTCSASDLSALADAARYTGRTDLAEEGLLALRSRFAQGTEGRSAAFLLGRLSEGHGAASDARNWYARYLSETPSGPYAAEALAGKMRTTMTLDGRAAASAIAEDYLRRYPTGVQAGTARGILGAR